MNKEQAKNFFRSIAKQIQKAKPGTEIRASIPKADQRIEALAGKETNKEAKKDGRSNK